MKLMRIKSTAEEDEPAQLIVPSAEGDELRHVKQTATLLLLVLLRLTQTLTALVLAQSPLTFRQCRDLPIHRTPSQMQLRQMARCHKTHMVRMTMTQMTARMNLRTTTRLWTSPRAHSAHHRSPTWWSLLAPNQLPSVQAIFLLAIVRSVKAGHTHVVPAGPSLRLVPSETHGKEGDSFATDASLTWIITHKPG